jgi:hypothetical protein
MIKLIHLILIRRVGDYQNLSGPGPAHIPVEMHKVTGRFAVWIVKQQTRLEI